MSLDKCIKRAGKALNKRDAEQLAADFGRMVDSGMDELEAGHAAIKNLDKSIDLELDDISKQAGISKDQAEPQPLFVFKDDKLVDANEIMREADEEISALDDIVRCAFGGAS